MRPAASLVPAHRSGRAVVAELPCGGVNAFRQLSAVLNSNYHDTDAIHAERITVRNSGGGEAKFDAQGAERLGRAMFAHFGVTVLEGPVDG
jgi:hypothetical protein